MQNRNDANAHELEVQRAFVILLLGGTAAARVWMLDAADPHADIVCIGLYWGALFFLHCWERRAGYVRTLTLRQRLPLILPAMPLYALFLGRAFYLAPMEAWSAPLLLYIGPTIALLFEGGWGKAAHHAS